MKRAGKVNDWNEDQRAGGGTVSWLERELSEAVNEFLEDVATKVKRIIDRKKTILTNA